MTIYYLLIYGNVKYPTVLIVTHESCRTEASPF